MHQQATQRTSIKQFKSQMDQQLSLEPTEADEKKQATLEKEEARSTPISFLDSPR